MKLRITRDQAKGMLGGTNFLLKAKVDLTNDEADLVKRYRAEKESLVQKELSIFGKKLTFDIKVKDLINGETFKCNDISDILTYEENVKDACKSFKIYIETMKNFGGEETIDF